MLVTCTSDPGAKIWISRICWERTCNQVSVRHAYLTAAVYCVKALSYG
jgi:hypothetical protein